LRRRGVVEWDLKNKGKRRLTKGIFLKSKRLRGIGGDRCFVKTKLK
jgi:hypothetical protein